MATAPELQQPHIMDTYGRLPIAIDHGRGCRVWDTQGKSYLDGFAGIAVNVLGHAHPQLVAALQDQVAKVIHTSNYFYIPNGEKLAAKLTGFAQMENAFFCNSGMEANECALKLARKHGHTRGSARPEVVVFDDAFHGRSLATLSATANPGVRAGFDPYVPGFIRIPRNDIAALEAAAAQHPDIAAVFFETIQGEGGIHPMDVAFLRRLRTLCDQHNWLMMVDEVQCGMGRTGKWFAFQWADVVPDVVALAKGIAAGVPAGAVLAGPKAAHLFHHGDHGTTFGGNPLAMRAGVETVRIMEEEHLLENAARVGAHLKQALQTALGNVPGVREIRGQGLMLGVELDRPCGDLAFQAADAGLLISVTAGKVIRLVPALIMTEAEADELVGILAPLVKTFLQNAHA